MELREGRFIAQGEQGAPGRDAAVFRIALPIRAAVEWRLLWRSNPKRDYRRRKIGRRRLHRKKYSTLWKKRPWSLSLRVTRPPGIQAVQGCNCRNKRSGLFRAPGEMREWGEEQAGYTQALPCHRMTERSELQPHTETIRDAESASRRNVRDAQNEMTAKGG
jgi:hypothetical protein